MPEPVVDQQLDAILTSGEVAARYRLRDPEAARRIMREAGAFIVARRLVVRVRDLAAWEARQEQAARGAQAGPVHGRRAASPPGRRSPRASGAPRRPPAIAATDVSVRGLGAGWWRSEDDAGPA